MDELYKTYIENKLNKDYKDLTINEIKTFKKYKNKSKWKNVYLIEVFIVKDFRKEFYKARIYLEGYGFSECELKYGKISGAVFKSGGKNYRIKDFE